MKKNLLLNNPRGILSNLNFSNLKKYLLKSVGIACCLLILSSTQNSFGQIGRCKGKYFGNIIAGNVPSTYTANWNQVTSENASKWGSVEGTMGRYNFTGSDICFNWAKNNNGLFKYHALIWGAQTPGWVNTAPTATITNQINPYFKAVSDHYAAMGGLKFIDVLNEPVNCPMPGNLKAALTAGYRAEPANASDLNNEYGWAIWCFQLARKYFPDATLLINEYNVEMNWNNCRAPYIAMTNAIKNAPNLTDGRRNLIDGVGLQAHGVENLTAANFKACIDEIWAKTGLPIHITEFDQTANPNEARQLEVYRRLIPVAWEHPHVAGITLWGYIQGSTWIRGNNEIGPGGTDSGIIYSGSYSANPHGDRPAMAWLRQYMASQASLSCCPAPAPFASCSNTPCTPTSITPYVQMNGGAWAQSSTATVNTGGSIVFGPQPVTGGSWRWTGPNGFTATTREIALTNIQANQAGNYVATYTNAGGCTSTATMVASVIVPCTPTAITPYVQINGGAWAQTSTASLNTGGSVRFGPQPVTGGSWSWSGPGNYSASTREITLSNIQTTQAGNYVATYTNAGGCTSTTTFVVTVNTPVNQPPTVSLTAPANNASFNAPASITISANAADADGSIVNVQFYNGNTLLNTDATAPYSFTWTNVAAGTYTISARATDNSGAVTTSTARTVVVNPAINNPDPVGTADVLGPDCGSINSSITFELNSSKRAGATAYTWWTNGYSQSITPVTGSPFRVNVQTGQYFTTTDICVGVSYNTAPWYATYCKTVTTCAEASKSMAVSEAVVGPNPSIGAFTLTAPEAVHSVSISNINGFVVYSYGKMAAGESITYGDNFTIGLYAVTIVYSSGRVETLRIQKL
ncbi:MAG: endo-1,4-beta-xylanase [Cytophagaceae bacterium]